MKKHYFIIVIFGIISLSTSTSVLAQSVPTKKSEKELCSDIYFRFGSSVIDSTYMSNSEEMSKLKTIFSKITNDPNAVIDSINVVVSGSPDGPYWYNKNLVESRAKSMKAYISLIYPEMQKSTFNLYSVPEDWSGLREAIAADANVPQQKKALSIIDSNMSSAQKKDKLIALDGGKTEKYLRSNRVYAKLRTGTSCTVWYTVVVDSAAIAPQKAEEAVVASDEEVAASDEAVVASEAAVVASEEEVVVSDEEVVVSDEEVVVSDEAVVASDEEVVVSDEVALSPKLLDDKKPITMSVKTNLPLLVSTTFNLGLELGFNDKFSVDVPVIFSPYSLNKDKYKFKIVTIQPEFRYWLRDNTRGSFFGAHIHTGFASVVSPILLNKNFNYRTTRPMFGFGVSYGYKVRLAKNWGLEGTLGFGYANVVYDRLPVNSGVVAVRGINKNYWGVTRAQINLTYDFDLRK